jgi:AcrR family transcriptional regulator
MTETSQQPTRTDRRRERTRARLAQAARELISEKGVAGLRISDITERADVGLGSFYNHFESKEELVEAVILESVAALAETVATPTSPDQDPAELVALAIRRFVRLAYDEPGFARMLVHLNHADTVFSVAVQPYARVALEAGIAAGRLHPTDLDVALNTIVGASLALMRGIVDRQVGADADVAWAESALRSLGVPVAEAAEIARRPIPA